MNRFSLLVDYEWNEPRYKVELWLSEKDDKTRIVSWLEENVEKSRYIWKWVPASSRRVVEFYDKDDCSKFMTFFYSLMGINIEETQT